MISLQTVASMKSLFFVFKRLEYLTRRKMSLLALFRARVKAEEVAKVREDILANTENK